MPGLPRIGHAVASDPWNKGFSGHAAIELGGSGEPTARPGNGANVAIATRRLARTNVKETIMNHAIARTPLGLALAASLTISTLSLSSVAAPVAPSAPARAADPASTTPVELAQYRRGYGPGPRYYAPGPRYYGPPRAYGGPAWGYRPWYRRPYYGTIIGGIALGTIIGATAYGLAPRPPRPDLCWYWADEIQSRGYWDYC